MAAATAVSYTFQSKNRAGQNKATRSAVDRRAEAGLIRLRCRCIAGQSLFCRGAAVCACLISVDVPAILCSPCKHNGLGCWQNMDVIAQIQDKVRQAIFDGVPELGGRQSGALVRRDLGEAAPPNRFVARARSDFDTRDKELSHQPESPRKLEAPELNSDGSFASSAQIFRSMVILRMLDGRRLALATYCFECCLLKCATHGGGFSSFFTGANPYQIRIAHQICGKFQEQRASLARQEETVGRRTGPSASVE